MSVDTDGDIRLDGSGTTPSVETSTNGSTGRNVRSFAKNTLMLTITSLTVSALGLIYRIYIARYLGDVGYGTYVFVTTFVSYFTVISQFGFRNVIVRQVAAARAELSEYSTVGMQLRLLTASAAVILTIVLAMSLERTQPVRLHIAVFSLSLLTVALTDVLEAALLGLEKAEYSTISATISNAIKVGAGILLLVWGYGIVAILELFVATSLLNFLLDWAFLRLKFGFRFGGDRARLKELRKYVFRESLPFVYIMLLSKVYYKNDILVLGWLKGDQVVGWYGGAYLAIDFLLLLGSSIAYSMFPIVSRMHAAKSANLGFSYERLCKYVFLLFAPICAGTSIVGAQYLPLLLGSRFSRGVDALQVLVWMVLFEALTLVAAMVLAATGNQKRSAVVACCSAVVNLSLNLALVPKMSYMGAAWGTTISAVTNFTAAAWMTKAVLPDASLPRALWRPALAAGAMTAAMLQARALEHVAGLLAVGAVVYVLALFVLRAIDADDRRIAGSLAAEC